MGMRLRICDTGIWRVTNWFIIYYYYNNWLNTGGDPDHRMDKRLSHTRYRALGTELIPMYRHSSRLDGIVFRIRHYWQIRKCMRRAEHALYYRRILHMHALAGIAIATMMSLRHRPLAEVCTVPVLLVHDLFLLSVLDVKDSLYLFHSQSPIVTSV